MVASQAGEWTTLQKLTPVIVGLGILILLGLVWCFYRAYRRRKYSRRAQGMYLGTNRSLGHHRNGSAGSYSSTSHLNAMNASQLSLPMHRIRFFFSGMLPVRERRRGSDWNIEGDPGLPRRSFVIDDSSSRRESEPFFTPTPSIHTRNDTLPASPATTRLPFQRMSRWWASVSPSKGRDYQAVHLLSGRKGSKLGADDDNHPEPAPLSSPPQNHRTSREGIPPVITNLNGERESVSHPRTPQPETDPPNTRRLPSLRPNRPGRIVAIEDPSPSQPLPSADVS